MNTQIDYLREQVLAANASSKPILIKSGGTKAFYGNHLSVNEDVAVSLDMTALSGVINYEPTELVITAWAGTPLKLIEDTLKASGQRLAFEPPSFGSQATLGGCIASGLSGPARQSSGPLKDFVLGSHLLDAQGNVLRFGGEVMKNVAGYDVSRMLAGSMGMFGVLSQVSVKVVPDPLETVTLEFDVDEQTALALCHGWHSQALPVAATAFDGHLFVRLAGAPSAVASARRKLGGAYVPLQAAHALWTNIREQTAEFFMNQRAGSTGLWRLAVAPNTPALNLGETVFEWGGGQRWVNSELDASTLRAAATRAGGHATLFRSGSGQRLPADGVFHPLSSGVAQIVKRLKNEFDPKGLFNPGRLVFGL
jgi:glycolate oxidase FAD binding subunit